MLSRLTARHVSTAILAALLWALQTAAVLALSFDANFDGGSLKAASVEGDLVRLTGRDNFRPGTDTWKWLYFRIDDAQDRRLQFVISDKFQSGSHRLDRWRMLYSYDNQEWEFFDHNARDPAAGEFRFSNDEPFTGATVYVAAGLVYGYCDAQRLTRDLLATPWATPTASADARGVLGHSPGGIDDLGRTITPKNLYGFRLTDPTATDPKTKVLLFSGSHPNEVHGGRVLDAMVRFLGGDDPRAAELRRRCEFFIYPLTNPDGRWAGYNRTSVAHPDRDFNRFWHPTLWADMQDLRTVGEAMIADTGGQVDYCIDFHSWSDTGPHFVITSTRAMEHHPFWRALSRLEPTLGYQASSGAAASSPAGDAGSGEGAAAAPAPSKTGAAFGRQVLGAEFSMTQETMFRPGENAERYRMLGENHALALHEALTAAEPAESVAGAAR